MKLRLLNKSDIAKSKAQERNTEVQEGLKLARRVDGLREISAQEEQALSKFRIETLSEIGQQIAVKEKEREQLMREVYDLEMRREAALVPLDAEWEEIEKQRHFLAEGYDKLDKYSFVLEEKAIDIQEQEDLLEENERRIVDMHKRTNDLWQEADTIKSETERKNRLAEEILHKAERESSELLDKAAQKDKEVRDRDDAVSAREKSQEEDRRELLKEWALLKDRQAMLERTLKRNK